VEQNLWLGVASDLAFRQPRRDDSGTPLSSCDDAWPRAARSPLVAATIRRRFLCANAVAQRRGARGQALDDGELRSQPGGPMRPSGTATWVCRRDDTWTEPEGGLLWVARQETIFICSGVVSGFVRMLKLL